MVLLNEVFIGEEDKRFDLDVLRLLEILNEVLGFGVGDAERQFVEVCTSLVCEFCIIGDDCLLHVLLVEDYLVVSDSHLQLLYFALLDHHLLEIQL
jgi:hypothetical protein